MSTYECFNCKQETIGPGTIEFQYKGFDFSVFKLGIECEACAQKKYKSLFDQYTDLVEGSKNSIRVDWEYYSRFRNSLIYRHRRKSEEEEKTMNELLFAIGVFSRSPKDNWEITTGAMSLNPSLHFSKLYFTEFEHVKGYAKAYLKNTEYSWWIQQISGVVSKAQIFAS